MKSTSSQLKTRNKQTTLIASLRQIASDSNIKPEQRLEACRMLRDIDRERIQNSLQNLTNQVVEKMEWEHKPEGIVFSTPSSREINTLAG